MKGFLASKKLMQLAIGAVFVPMVLGTSCPFFPGSTTLLSVQLSAQPVAGGFVDTCATATGVVQTSFQADASKPVTVRVTGPTSNSRPEIVVGDQQNNTVLNTGTTPSAQTNQGTFTPTATNVFNLFVVECGANITGNYTIVVTQAAF